MKMQTRWMMEFQNHQNIKREERNWQEEGAAVKTLKNQTEKFQQLEEV